MDTAEARPLGALGQVLYQRLALSGRSATPAGMGVFQGLLSANGRKAPGAGGGSWDARVAAWFSGAPAAPLQATSSTAEASPVKTAARGEWRASA
jgi:hypothetical protein